jgi:hypothetical protein
MCSREGLKIIQIQGGQECWYETYFLYGECQQDADNAVFGDFQAFYCQNWLICYSVGQQTLTYIYEN